jgi:MFS superfamily sulfate permease-like transporter
LIGLGASNFGAGLFQGFPIGSSLSKSAANDRAGAKSQMSAMVAALVTVIVALFFTQWFYALPEATLGAIVIVAVSGMVKVEKIRHLYQVSRSDFLLAMVALFAVLTFETLEALLISVIVSVFALAWRSSQPRLAVLGCVPNRIEFSDVRRHPENIIWPSLLIVRPENGLFFANASAFHQAILDEISLSPEPVKAVLVDLGATTDLDEPSAEVVKELKKDLQGRGVGLMLARVISPVQQTLVRNGAMKLIEPKDIFSSPQEAVLDYFAADANLYILIHGGLMELRDLIDKHKPNAPKDRLPALSVLSEKVEIAIKQTEIH